MDFSVSSMGIAFAGGLLSVASPCVLPVVPILLAARENTNKWRPVFVVAGLSLAFIAMGVIASLAGSALAGNMRLLEKGAGVLLVIFAFLMAFDVNIFKKVQVFNRIQVNDNGGNFSGFLVGITLGLVWIPCVGPVLSGILAMVASQANLVSGIVLLGIYSCGFAVPMLLVAYFSRYITKRIRFVSKHPRTVRMAGALLLGALGVFLFTQGMVSLVVL